MNKREYPAEYVGPNPTLRGRKARVKFSQTSDKRVLAKFNDEGLRSPTSGLYMHNNWHMFAASDFEIH